MGRADDLAVNVLRQGSVLRIKARGASMLPLLRDGDVVTVTPTVPATIRVGDVICYEGLSGGLILHRAVAWSGDGVLAKGDALATAEIVDRARILGVVTAIERCGRTRRFDTAVARVGNRVMALLSRRSSLFPFSIDVARRVRAAGRG